MTKHDQVMKIIEKAYIDCKAEGKPVTADIVGEIMYSAAGLMYDEVHAELDLYKESWAGAEPPPGFPLLTVRKILDDQKIKMDKLQKTIDDWKIVQISTSECMLQIEEIVNNIQ